VLWVCMRGWLVLVWCVVGCGDVDVGVDVGGGVGAGVSGV
jgi:hypothetical protein